MPYTNIESGWVSGSLVFYEKTVGQSVTGDVFTLGTTAVKVGGTSQDVDFQWYASGSKSFILDAGAGTLTMVGLDVSIDGDLTIDLEDLQIGDNQYLQFGDATGGDVSARWVSATSLLEILPAVDNTGKIYIGNGTTDIDFRVYLGTNTAYVDFNVAAASLVVSAGVQLDVDDTTAASSATTGSIHTAGGIGIAGALWVGTTSRLVGAVTCDGAVSIDDTTASSSTVTGSIHTDGGLGVVGATFLGSTLTVGVSDAGYDVTFYGDTVGCNFLWDQNLDTNGGLQLGADTKATSFYAYGATTGNYLKWDAANDDLIIAGTSARVLHGADAAGNDAIFYGAVASYAVTWDANGDTNGSWSFGADTKGLMVSLYGDTTGCGVFWDPSTDTNGTLSIGATGGSKGNDVVAYGATNGNYLQWDQSANSLLLVGTSTILNIAGTTASSSTSTGSLITAGGLGVAGDAYFGGRLDVTATGLHATTGRVGQFTGSVADPNQGDGYGVFEVDVTVSGTLAGTTNAFSSWLNFAAGSVPGSNIVCAQNNGIWLPSGITASSAKMVMGMRMHYVADDGADPGSLFCFSTNISDNILTAMFDVNTIADLGGASGAQTGNDYKIPLFKTANDGQVWYVNVYHT